VKRFRLLLSTLLAVTLLAAGAVPVSGAGPADEIRAAHVPETVLVKFKNGVSAAVRRDVAARYGLIEQGRIYGTDTLVMQGRGKSTSALMKALAGNPFVKLVEPDYVASIQWTPNDLNHKQWGPQKMQAPEAWDLNQGSPGVLIAVVDTGVDLDHPDLTSKVRTDLDYDFVHNDVTADDDNGHGSHVAGTAAAATNNGTGMAGVCPSCQILPVKVLNAQGSGSYSAIAAGIRWAADHGADVINLSLGGSAGSTVLQDAVNYADSRGVLLACAAGNSNTSAPSYPAYYPACVAVAATDSADRKATFSNYGSWVDTSAPGTGIWATYKNGQYRSLSGTSMAAPHVAGLAGLLFSQGRTKTDVRSRLTRAAYTDPVGTASIPRRINAFKALGN